ncbi:MBL fold metallo-hydrolase [Oleiharenicola lentus]|uniref:MBL fold metallo-hydrolase n=1 Tax=Oleiharenicola lentus TaxID=2508720 RepID=UPI003F6616C9
MAMRMKILGSGSSGNCAVLCSEGSRVLIDVGFAQRKLRQLLHDAGEALEKIDAIFLTHEHGDHAAGIDALKKFPHIKLFANSATAAAVQSKLDFRPEWQLFQTGSRFHFRDLEVESFHVPHDAQEPVGFTFSHGHDDDLFTPRRRIAWLTDLGHAPAHIPERIRDVDVLVVEANHCPQMLEADVRRPWSTKQRISGRHGHLSNQRMCELLANVTNPRWRHVFLTHLSRDCNSNAAVETALAPLRTRLTCQFSVVAAGGGSELLEF